MALFRGHRGNWSAENRAFDSPGNGDIEESGNKLPHDEPRDKVKPHYHINGKEEAYFILSGTGEITHRHRTTGEVEEIKIEKNMAIYIEPEMIHDIRCTGSEPLWLLVMSYPPLIGETAKLADA